MQYPVAFAGASYDPAKLEKVNDAVQLLETFLSSSEYAVGDSLTLADLSLVTTVSTLEAAGYDFSPYSNVNKWYSKVKQEIPGYEEANGKNVLIFKNMFEQLTKK